MKKILLFLVIASILSACSSNKGSNPTPGNNVISPPSGSDTTKKTPVITSISVNTGPFNTVVIVTGTGFGATSDNDQFFFNKKSASILTATTTQITARVPLGAGTGNVSLLVNNGTTVTGPIFTYQLSEFVTTFACNSTDTLTGLTTSTKFVSLNGIAVDNIGNLYVTDGEELAAGVSVSGSNYTELIRKITPNGITTTLAGAFGPFPFFNYPTGLTIDAKGNIYIADTGNNVIREVSASGIVSTFAGNGRPGMKNGFSTSAYFSAPYGLTIDAVGNIYVTELGNDAIRKITPAVLVSTLAGNGFAGSNNGIGIAATFSTPTALAADMAGNLYVADYSNNLIRKISPAGVVTTLAGNGTQGSADGTGISATFNAPQGIAVDAAGNVYVADEGNNKIRKISPTGVVTTLAGSGSKGSANNVAASASFNAPSSLAVDALGNVYVADFGNNLIREISLEKIN